MSTATYVTDTRHGMRLYRLDPPITKTVIDRSKVSFAELCAPENDDRTDWPMAEVVTEYVAVSYSSHLDETAIIPVTAAGEQLSGGGVGTDTRGRARDTDLLAMIGYTLH